MKGKKVFVADCQKGDILAQDVFLSNGVLLITRNSLINEYIIERLSEHRIEEVNILQQIESSSSLMREYTKGIEKINGIFKRLIAGERMDVSEVDKIAGRLVPYLDQPSSVAACLSDVRVKDEYTYAHSVNVAFYSLIIAKWLGLSRHDCRKAVQAGLLHDVGKLLIPDSILNKPGRLTDKEFTMIKQHPLLGYNLLAQIPNLSQEVREAALLHHERLDGQGYPTQTPLGQVGILSRIVAVADVFDSMTTDRIYKKAVNPFEAFEMFASTGLSQFDPFVLNTFLVRMPSCYTGSKVQLSSGEEGEIVYVPPYRILSPIVKINAEYRELGPFHQTKIIKLAI
ncbi:HD-GYP domain-containing protein [Gorillibacterium timonense]|uniref:HD-GYP domain-containing protein n=1 Tax=Gorillibacterium timonense TaxID=1689269 RepID=UPI00071C7DDE|nr:HD-GYP domain-containing protein [Gorillibacterium timonense]